MKLPGIILLACGLSALPVAIVRQYAQEADITGPAKVVDGDSLEIDGKRIRLAYIDAPELFQPCRAPSGEPWQCGKIAKLELARIIGNEIVTCKPVDRDRYARFVAMCFVGEIDVGQVMVSNGYAIAYAKYGRNYEADELGARVGKRGIWTSEFVQPEIWRMQKRGGGR